MFCAWRRGQRGAGRHRWRRWRRRQKGLISLIEVVDEAPGEYCAQGGVRVDVGIDANGDGVLGGEEVSASRYICDGADGQDGTNGLNNLIKMVDEAPGELCAQGGERVDVGIDANNDGVLDPTEITTTRYICDGEDGDDGQNSEDGLNRLIELREEAPRDACPYGGTGIEVGLDLNANGVFDPDEVAQFERVCDDALVTELMFPFFDTIARSNQGAEATLGENANHAFFLTSHYVRQTFSADQAFVVRSFAYRIPLDDQTSNADCPVGTLSFELLLNNACIDTFSNAGGNLQNILEIEGLAEFAPMTIDGTYTLQIRPLNAVCGGGRYYTWLAGGSFVLNGQMW